MFGYCGLLIIFSIILPGNAQNRIIGGKDAEDRIKYQASLRDNENVHQCSGTIVHIFYILTAAECISKNPTKIYVGSNSLDAGTAYGISKKIPHEKYDAVKNLNNIGLIKSTESITLDDSVATIAIFPFRFGDNLALILTGWGSQSPTEGLNANMQELVTITKSRRDCSAVLGTNIPDEVLCTSTVDGQGACHGDIGDPLVTNNLLVGIMTSKYKCGNGPDQSTRVQSYFWWIVINIIIS